MTIEEDFSKQAAFLEGKSPGYAALLRAIPLDHQTLREAWANRSFFAVYDRPLLLLAALRASALRDGKMHPLQDVLVGGAAGPIAKAAIAEVLGRQDVMRDLRERFVQTNETTRAVTWLWPAALLAPKGPVVLVDIGCSAGLNLIADALPRIWQPAMDFHGTIMARYGFDLRPMDVRNTDDALWLRACIWPGDHERVTRLEAGIAAMLALSPSPIVEARDVMAIPERLEAIANGTDALVIAYQTVMRDYIQPKTYDAYRAAMLARLSKHVVWMELETAPEDEGAEPAGIFGHTHHGSFLLARCAYHPRELTVDDAAVAAFI